MSDEEKLRLIRGLAEDYDRLEIGMHEFVRRTREIIELDTFTWVPPAGPSEILPVTHVEVIA